MNGTLGQSLWIRAYDWLTTPVLTIGDQSLSVANILKFLLFVVFVVWAGLRARRLIRTRAFPKLQAEHHVAETLGNAVGTTIIVLGLLIGLQTIGVKLQALHVVFGAIGIGVGFGLQNLASNCVAGLIIQLEKPIQMGDRIQLGELHGRVTRIKIRATEIHTNDNISVIVPNSEFIAQRVINWSRGGNRIRVRVPVPVAYGSDVGRVRQALLEAAGGLDVVLDDPKPEVRLTGFGQYALHFELLGWTSEMLQRRGAFVSRLNFAVLEALARHDIKVPYPPREVIFRSPEREEERPGTQG